MAYRIPPPGQPISLFDVQSEFGGEVPIAIDEYYGVDDGVPVSGTISLGDFYGTSGRFVWCDGDMSNVVVGIADEVPDISALSPKAHHGDNTTLLILTGDPAKVLITIVNDDGTISSHLSVNTIHETKYNYSGLNNTEGYRYDEVVGEIDHYIIDTSTDDLLVFDGTPVAVPPPSAAECMGMEIVYEFDDGIQFVVWTFDDAADIFDIKAYSLRGGVLTQGTTLNIPGDTHDKYHYSQARQDSFFLAYGQQYARLFYISPTTNEITQVMEHLTTEANSFSTKTYGQISGKSHIVVVTRVALGSTLEVTNVSEDGTTSVVYIPTTLLYQYHDGICLTGNCLVVGGYDNANTKKKKIVKTTVYEDSMDEFTTLYLQQDESPVEFHYQFMKKAGIHTKGNKWLFFTKDVASENTRLSSLTVDPYIIPDPQGSKYIGFPCNDEGIPDLPGGTWNTYGINGETAIYATKITAPEVGTAVAINIHATMPSVASENVYVVLYNGDILVGTAALDDNPANDWSGYIPLVAESGQSLSFSDGDILRFGIAHDDYVDGEIDNDSGGVDGIMINYSTQDFSDKPPSPIANWSESGSYHDLGAILEYSTPSP